jgi:hypothetical protein
MDTRVLGTATVFLTILCTNAARGLSVDDRLASLDHSMQNCLQSASRPGFPYYDRPEASDSCKKAKVMLRQFEREANQNRNLACSSRIAALDFDLWMIQFAGGVRMREKTDEDMAQLARNCVNMDSR